MIKTAYLRGICKTAQQLLFPQVGQDPLRQAIRKDVGTKIQQHKQWLRNNPQPQPQQSTAPRYASAQDYQTQLASLKRRQAQLQQDMMNMPSRGKNMQLQQQRYQMKQQLQQVRTQIADVQKRQKAALRARNNSYGSDINAFEGATFNDKVKTYGAMQRENQRLDRNQAYTQQQAQQATQAAQASRSYGYTPPSAAQLAYMTRSRNVKNRAYANRVLKRQAHVNNWKSAPAPYTNSAGATN